jgi:hypothetical protein
MRHVFISYCHEDADFARLLEATRATIGASKSTPAYAKHSLSS